MVLPTDESGRPDLAKLSNVRRRFRDIAARFVESYVGALADGHDARPDFSNQPLQPAGNVLYPDSRLVRQIVHEFLQEMQDHVARLSQRELSCLWAIIVLDPSRPANLQLGIDPEDLQLGADPE
jgi:hypothetical protein